MSRANMIIRNKFSYKKIVKSLIHMIWMLVTLIINDDQQSDELQILRNVMQRSDWSEWHDVMKRKFNSLVENQIWDLVERFDINQQMIIERWIYKLKKNRNENLICYKARWIAHDFKQRYEVNFDETFASIVKLISYKTLITISAKRKFANSSHERDYCLSLWSARRERLYWSISHVWIREE
jgi:adenylate kinase family enzyme